MQFCDMLQYCSKQNCTYNTTPNSTHIDFFKFLKGMDIFGYPYPQNININQ